MQSNASSYSFGSWANSSYVNVTLSCDDGTGSGCNITKYCADTNNTCTPSTTYSSPVQVSTQGVSYIRYLSNDSVNNTETAKSSTMEIDTILPAVSIQSPLNQTYNVSTINLNYTATDSGSGISVCSYKLDSGSITSLPGCANSSSAISSVSEGSHTDS